MTSQFLLIIEKKDSEKLRVFRANDFKKSTNEILDKNDATHVWGIHKAKISNLLWSKIKKNDKIYLTVKNENFKISGIVSKKTKNLKFGEIIYPDVIDKKQIINFLFFKNLQPCNISYNELVENSEAQKLSRKEGIHKINNDYFIEKKIKIKPKKFNPDEKVIGKAKRSKSEVFRYVRNQGKVKRLKNLYHNKCQIVECGFTFEHNIHSKKEFYSEVHHYNPLKKQSDDDFGNMIVLCPNHHAEFDYSTKFIHRDGISIINQSGNDIGETIKFHKLHTLDMKNIESQLG
jgi:predicted restriction endonuclease